MSKRNQTKDIAKVIPVLPAAFGIMVIFLLSSCQHEFLPKPIGYNRLILPAPSYQSLPDTLPYHFEYSIHSKLLPDTSSIRGPFWIEIYYPELKSNIHITYKKVFNNEQLLKEFVDDSYRLTSKHQIKAYAIDEVIVKTPSGKAAVVEEIQGEVPSQFQFTMTDSTNNFIRGGTLFQH